MSEDIRNARYIQIPESGTIYKSLGTWFQNSPQVDSITDSNGNLIWGNINKYPYELLDYIDIPSGCYLNLSVAGNSTVGCYVDANWNIDGDSFASDSLPFGSIRYNGSSYYRYHLVINNSIGMRAAYANSSYSSLPQLFSAANSNNRYVLELNYHTYNDKKAYVDNVEKGTFNPTASQTTGDLFIGARRFDNNGTITINDYTHTMRVYSIKIKTASDTEYTYYPVIQRATGKIGLLRYVNGSKLFIGSQTSVSPIQGTVSNYYWNI